MPQDRRRTKIVCTIGPSSNSRKTVESLIKNGMNVARLNFSHGSHEDHLQVIENVQEVASRYRYSIPILMDLQGPKIRVGRMKNEVQDIKTGTRVELTPEDIEGDDGLIPVDYPNLAKDAEAGNTILMDDGMIELKVTGKNGQRVKADVVVGGPLKSRKGVNLPDVEISMSSLTEKDLRDLEFGVEQGVDLIAMSFVRSPLDIQEIISRIRANNSHASVIAKIEKPEAVDSIDEIITEADGIMVARGDLGIELPSERVPMIQKKLIQKSRVAGKPVITATQMLESMLESPRPTRAESSDVANAVMDGTDAVMLSGETAIGDYPVESVRVMDNICRTVEKESVNIYQSLTYRKPEWKEKQVIESLAYSCVRMAEFVEAKAISTITHSGNTARRIAKFRPEVPIVAFTESNKVRRQLNLVWGVTPVRLDEIFDTDSSVRLMENHLKEHGMVEEGDRVIIATGMPIAKRGRTNMIKVSTIG